MKVLVEVYDSCKYERGSKKVGEARYDIESFEVKQISDEEIYSMGFDEVDPYGEYLILTLTGGETSTFRNSFCDMFRDYEAEAKDRALAEVEQYMDKHQFRPCGAERDPGWQKAGHDVPGGEEHGRHHQGSQRREGVKWRMR